MKLSAENQELLDDMYPDGYVFKKITLHNGNVVDERDSFHILFVKIIPQPGQRTNIINGRVQIISVKDWLHQNNKGVESGKGMKAQIEKYGIGGITQFNEYAVIHDPIAAKKEAAALKEAEEKVEAEKKKKEETVAKAAATRKKTAEAKQGKSESTPEKVESQN